MADPVQYLHLLREALPHDDYLHFCKIMAAYKSQRMSTQDTVTQVLNLFGERSDLKKGFQIFLPENYPDISVIPKVADEFFHKVKVVFIG